LVNVGGSYDYHAYFQGGKWGIIDTSGKYLVEPMWEYANRLYDGNIIATLDGKQGLVDNHGVQIIPAVYDNVYYSNNFDGRIVLEVKLGSDCGLFDTENRALLPLMFNSVGIDRRNYYSVGNSDGSGYGGEIGIIELIKTPFLSGEVFVNGEKVEFDNPPLLINSRTMMPVRAVFEKLGCTVEWLGDSETAVIMLGDLRVQIKQDTNYITKNDSYIFSDTAAINYNSRIYVPLRVISEAIGCNVSYNDATGNVTILY